jgi:hypothetical protein
LHRGPKCSCIFFFDWRVWFGHWLTFTGDDDDPYAETEFFGSFAAGYPSDPDWVASASLVGTPCCVWCVSLLWFYFHSSAHGLAGSGALFPSNLPANQDVPLNPLPNRLCILCFCLIDCVFCAFFLSLPAPKKEIISDGGQSISYTLPTTEESYPSYIS